MPTEVIMPKLGDSVGESTVSRWLKREGEAISEYEPLLEVSSDKVDTEIPAPSGGILLQILVPVGEVAKEGTCIAVIGDVAERAQSLTAGSAPEQQSSSIDGSAKEYAGYLSPVVSRMIAEHNLDVAKIKGTGRDGRITKKDVQAYLAAGDTRSEVDTRSLPLEASPAQPTRVHPVEPIPQAAPGELIPLSAMRRAIAEHMVRSKLQTSPHVTTVFEFDMSSVLMHREANKDAFSQQGVNLTLTAYFAAAAVKALQSQRYLNAEWRDAGIYLHNVVNLGIAVALTDGLIVPVIKNAGDLNLLGIARAVNDLSSRARSKQLKPEEVQGGTFTITNHGVSGSLFATPIINQPQVGILGVGIMEKRVKVINDMLAIRPCCYVTLTFDHRVADGAVGDAFMLKLKDMIENWS
jgi:2-oxoglutarate dehydrogenase E2 component (dihydrolipoamide succinyltransferase)